MNKVVITNLTRTAIGSFNGSLASQTAPQLGSIVIKSLIQSSGIAVEQVDEVIMGNVLSAGIGQAPARQAALNAGLPEKTEALTINKMCGSGLKAVMLAAQAIQCEDAEVIIAGGQESMSNSPYLLQKARTGYKLGHGQLVDSVISDGLWDVYNNIHMGSCAEKCARDFNMTRQEVDDFAIQSYKHAQEAQQSGKFKDEITPVNIKTKDGVTVFDRDEDVDKVNFAKISGLRPVFDKEGIVTAANASNLNDGAAAVIVLSEKKAKELGLKPQFEIIAQASSAKAPIDFTTAPADAILKVLKRANLSINDIGLFEINEAFAVVSLAVNKIVGLKADNINVNGGAIALGHPIGASGARILATLGYEMKRRNIEFGLAALCIGGGEASAVIIKNI